MIYRSRKKGGITPVWKWNWRMSWRNVRQALSKKRQLLRRNGVSARAVIVRRRSNSCHHFAGAKWRTHSRCYSAQSKGIPVGFIISSWRNEELLAFGTTKYGHQVIARYSEAQRWKVSVRQGDGHWHHPKGWTQFSSNKILVIFSASKGLTAISSEHLVLIGCL